MWKGLASRARHRAGSGALVLQGQPESFLGLRGQTRAKLTAWLPEKVLWSGVHSPAQSRKTEAQSTTVSSVRWVALEAPRSQSFRKLLLGVGVGVVGAWTQGTCPERRQPPWACIEPSLSRAVSALTLTLFVTEGMVVIVTSLLYRGRHGGYGKVWNIPSIRSGTQQGGSGKPHLISEIINQQNNAASSPSPLRSYSPLQLSLISRLSKAKLAPFLHPFSIFSVTYHFFFCLPRSTGHPSLGALCNSTAWEARLCCLIWRPVFTQAFPVSH